MEEITVEHPSDLLRGVGEVIRYEKTIIWPVITRNLGPRDLYSLSDAHPYWFMVLQRRRPNFLLQLCLPHLTSLNLSDLLNLRLVSKGWKQVVDHYLQHQIYEEEPLFINESKQALPDFNICERHLGSWTARHRQNVFVLEVNSVPNRNHPRQISDWLDSIEWSPFPLANPILSREAIFSVRGFREQTAEMQKETVDVVTRCLRAHGRHLLRCTFDMNLDLIGVRSFDQEYSQLRDWLQLVPNLISLEVDFCRLRPIHDEAELAIHIQENPLPELPNLSSLRVDCLPPPLFQALVQKYNQVQTLELGIGGLGEYRLDPVRMDNLKILKAEVGGPDGLVSLQQLITKSWAGNLHTLEMLLEASARIVTWGVLIDFLNSNFCTASKLVKVGLNMPRCRLDDHGGCSRIFRDSQSCRLRLPRVEQLKLQASNLFIMDFLLPMRSTLKKLAIANCHKKVLKECQQLIQWNGWLGRGLLISNIWEALPKLNFVRAHYTRYCGWTYRRREEGAPIFIFPYGKELSYEENIDWEEAANGNGGDEDH